MSEHYRYRKDKRELSSTWRLPIKDGHYVKVYVWNTPEAMHANVLDAGDPQWEAGKYAACFLGMGSIERDGEKFVPVMFGEIHLVLNKFGVGVVTHEITHCVLNWIREWEVEDDEEICWIMGEMSRKFWNAFHRRYKESA